MSARTQPWQADWLAGAVASIVLTLSSLAEPTPALAISPDQIPSPRPAGWTADLTSRIPPDTVAALNRLGDEVRQQTGAELAVVVVESTDGADPHQFATDLFNRWQIGQAGKNNGLLVFAALGDHKAEIILGDGVSNEAQALASRQILREVVLSRFKEGDPGGAVFRGARACAERILGARLEPLQAEAADPAARKAEAAPAPPLQQAPPLPLAPPRVGPPAVAFRQQTSFSGVLAWLFGGMGSAGALVFGARKYLRYHSRWCPGCGGSMTRLSEAADDEYLSAGERTEERLGSVDYDVWACGTCGKTSKLRHGAFFTRYSRCPTCRAKTKSTVSRTIRAATYTQGGLVEIEDLCHNCSYRNTRTHSTPLLTAATAASTPVWSSTGGVSPAPSAPSPMPGSGFSGGHSSGGGASGGW